MKLTDEQLAELESRLAEAKAKEEAAYAPIQALDKQKTELIAKWSPLYAERISIEKMLEFARKDGWA